MLSLILVWLWVANYVVLTLPFCSLQVSQGSVVKFPSQNFSSTAETEERSFPQGNEHLLDWARKEYGAVTSFTEVKMARNIYIKLGEGESVSGRFTAAGCLPF